MNSDVAGGAQKLLAWHILRRMNGNEIRQQKKDNLTEREIEVLRLLTQGKLDEEIARELVLAEVTIRTHISRILTKLGLENRVQAALYGLRLGLVSISETAEVLDAQHRSFPTVLSVSRKHTAHQPQSTY